ncbi:MAG TPA: 50S ribosomal protein L2 [Candidatus Nanoarchaeia archaeon]|nr:large subunit ribosomal protein L2 [uncultured archaeon]HJX49978.1 50S ribosomal protein L2 [Candidatus Nanoarchaeia archaeon]
MGKRIIQQRRGRGSNTYRVRRQAFRYKIRYPRELSGEGVVIKLLNSPAHTSPLAKIKYNKGVFYIPAFKGMIEGQKVSFGGKEIKEGNILQLKDIPMKTRIYNIESRPGDGGIFIRTGGNCAEISKIIENDVFVLLPSKKERKFNPGCRATIGEIAGSGRLKKPIIKAGKMHYMMRAKNRLWPRTSAVKMNVVDHPFGSGRGKRIKSKIAKRNAPAGRKVGLIRPQRTGKRK